MNFWIQVVGSLPKSGYHVRKRRGGGVLEGTCTPEMWVNLERVYATGWNDTRKCFGGVPGSPLAWTTTKSGGRSRRRAGSTVLPDG